MTYNQGSSFFYILDKLLRLDIKNKRVFLFCSRLFVSLHLVKEREKNCPYNI